MPRRGQLAGITGTHPRTPFAGLRSRRGSATATAGLSLLLDDRERPRRQWDEVTRSYASVCVAESKAVQKRDPIVFHFAGSGMVLERILLVGVKPMHIAEVKVTKGSKTIAHVQSSTPAPSMSAGEFLQLRAGGRAGMLLELQGIPMVGNAVVLCVQLTDDAPRDSELEALASYRKRP
jgi:hypothetical protein